jgi:uncharacterized phage-like protein YoqJ
MIIAITGHRPKYLNNEYNGGPITDYICVELQKIIDKYKPYKMISGMALGVDTIWAELALSNEIPLIAAVPFPGQKDIWPEYSRARYSKILDQAHRIQVISEKYDFHAFHKRDEWMVDYCDMLIAVLHKENVSSGTAHTAKYGEKQGVKVIYIDPFGGPVGEPCGE